MAAYTIPIHYAHAALRGVHRAGLDVAPILAKSGIPRSLLEDRRARITPEQCAALIRNVSLALDDELMGLAAQPRRCGTFAMMCIAAVHTPDLAAMIRRASRFYRMFDDGPHVYLVTSGDSARVELGLDGLDDPDHLLTEACLTVWHRFSGWMLGRRIHLQGVEFPYPRPSHHDYYDQIFGCPLHFDAPRAAVTFDSNVLSAPIAQDEDSLMPFLRNSPADMLMKRDYGTTTADQTRRIMQRHSGETMPTPAAIAARLAMSPQTLRRRLADLGTSTTEIRDEIYRDRAIAALVRGETAEAIAEQLGFSAPSAFHRAFKRWTGSTPAAYRDGYHHAMK